MKTEGFDGAKVAVLIEDRVLTLLRDDSDHIPFPGMWDLPGGGREGQESPVECALRELKEELSIALGAAAVTHSRSYNRDGRVTWFFVARAPSDLLSSVVLGDEGQTWQAMQVHDFLASPNAVPHLKQRLSDALEIFSSN